MRLYLVRHGKSDFGPVDETRELSERGRHDIEQVAQHLAAQEIRPDRIRHSTLTRARQTAEIFADALSPRHGVQELDGVEPWGDVDAFASLAATWDDNTLVCGHEPFMGQAAAVLLTGSKSNQVTLVKTGTVMAFERSPYGPAWAMRWMISPRLIRGPKGLGEI